jgi:hypothetical protein
MIDVEPRSRSAEERVCAERILLVLAAAKLLVHLAVNAFASYGVFRDEFYYLACSRRLDWGYVDHPPLSVFLLALQTFLFGDSLFALRLLPAMAGALTLYFAGRIALQLGGGPMAVLLAGISVLAAPIYLAFNAFYSMNAFDLLVWVLAAHLLLRVLQEGTGRNWLLLGVLLGLGLLNKIGVLWLGLGVFVALLSSAQRRQFKTRWPYVAAALALLIFLPYILWNAANNWPHLAFVAAATQTKYAGITRVDFLLGQLLNIAFCSFLLCALALYRGLRRGAPEGARALAILFVVALAVLLVNGHSKAEYLAAAYAPLLASGAVFLEEWLARVRPSRRRLLGVVLLLFIASGGLVPAPIVLPVLPVDSAVTYAQRLGIAPPSNEGKEMGQLHQFFADMFGWQEMAATVADVYRQLPADEREKALVFAGNYGEAGAIEYYARQYELPAVISGHNNYWLWAIAEREWQTLIAIGASRAQLELLFAEVAVADTFHCDYCMPYENGMPVYLARAPRKSRAEVWSEIKHFE